VQAKVYDADTRAVLATLNLTDNGNRWFSKSWKVPYDQVWSNGRWVLIVTSVYTDSGYTTRSENHADESEEYLVQQRWNPTVHYGAGGRDIDEEKLAKLLSAAIGEQLKPLIELEPVEFPEVDVEGLKNNVLAGVEECVGRYFAGIKYPETDLKPVLEQLTALAQVIIERPKFKETDQSQVLQNIESIKNFLSSMRDDTVTVLEEVIVALLKENTQLKTLTSGGGGKISIEMNTGDEKKQRILQRLAMKHGIKPQTV